MLLGQSIKQKTLSVRHSSIFSTQKLKTRDLHRLRDRGLPEHIYIIIFLQGGQLVSAKSFHNVPLRDISEPEISWN